MSTELNQEERIVDSIHQVWSEIEMIARKRTDKNTLAELTGGSFPITMSRADLIDIKTYTKKLDRLHRLLADEYKRHGT